MTQNPLIWIGLGGIGPDDNPRAQQWQQRLHGVMICVALLALPAYLLDLAGQHPALHRIAATLDVTIFVAFLLETVWMLYVTSFRTRYVLENWLNVVILVGAAASAMGAATEWVALIRVARVAVGSLVLLRALSEFRVLFTRRGAPMLVGAAALVMLGGGGIMYWLEPSVNTYWDGLWLAFTTGTTIGYGDFVPTSPAARVFAVFMAITGVALMTLFTANVVAFFVGSGEAGKPEAALAAATQAQAARTARLEESVAAVAADVRALRVELAELRALLASPTDVRGRQEPRA